MQEAIKKGRDFRIIPEKYESSTIFTIKNFDENENIVIELPIASETELNDYALNSEVEMFGSAEGGLIYFVSTIENKNGNLLTIKAPKEHKNIQRREYSRVNFAGSLTIDGHTDAILVNKDISAGGLRFISKFPFDITKEYNINVELSNNLNIKCSMQPIRCTEIEFEGNTAYTISSKFKNMESIDRIALVQYSFRAMTEAENKE